ncbi:hypothetical protein HYX06_05215 [Candidatus Woesearchaeota archaeon]|nr:hypothetical protein [Candidatus Woesearchaeota archaeon]
MTELILLDIFSYSCMNCLRSLDCIKKIDDSYRKYGLKTIIIHAPEWDFEKSGKNILNAAEKYKIKIPIIIDKNRRIIKKLSVNFWPAQILMSDGKELYRHIGEGNYKKLESSIIKNLKIKTKSIFHKEPKYSKFPTLYCGKRKGKKIRLNGWIQKNEYIKSIKTNSVFTIKTKGKAVNFVAESLENNPITAKIKLNRAIVKKITINVPQLYNLIKTNDSKQKELVIIAPKKLAVYSFSYQ